MRQFGTDYAVTGPYEFFTVQLFITKYLESIILDLYQCEYCLQWIFCQGSKMFQLFGFSTNLGKKKGNSDLRFCKQLA